LVSGDAQRLWHRDAECLSRFEIDNQQILHWHLHRKFRWLCASQDIVHILSRTAKIILEVCGIGNETTVSGHDRWPIDRRQVVARRQRYDGRAVIVMKVSGATNRAPLGSWPSELMTVSISVSL